MDIDSTVKLNNGLEMPRLGLGTWLMTPAEARRSAGWALEAGYRLIDTAKLYGNEKAVGEAARASGVPRERVFVTTKLIDSDQGYRSAFRGFEESLDRLGLAYIDLYLVHFPVQGLRDDSWRALLEILETGKARAIGVSNYVIEHLEELLAWSPVVPAVNQVMCNPYVYPRELIQYCRDRGIVFQGYSPLVHGRRLGDPALVRIASRYGKTPAQVLLRWSLEKGVPAIPKTVHRERVLENADIFNFELEPADMSALDALEVGIL